MTELESHRSGLHADLSGVLCQSLTERFPKMVGRLVIQAFVTTSQGCCVRVSTHVCLGSAGGRSVTSAAPPGQETLEGCPAMQRSPLPY